MRREKLEVKLNFYYMRHKLVSFLGLSTVHFCSLPFFLRTGSSQNCTMGRLDLRMTLLQIRPVLTSYLLLRPNSTTDSLRQIVILQLHRHEARSAATYRLHTTCARLNCFEASFKPPPGSGLVYEAVCEPVPKLV